MIAAPRLLPEHHAHTVRRIAAVHAEMVGRSGQFPNTRRNIHVRFNSAAAHVTVDGQARYVTHLRDLRHAPLDQLRPWYQCADDEGLGPEHFGAVWALPPQTDAGAPAAFGPQGTFVRALDAAELSDAVRVYNGLCDRFNEAEQDPDHPLLGSTIDGVEIRLVRRKKRGVVLAFDDGSELLVQTVRDWHGWQLTGRTLLSGFRRARIEPDQVLRGWWHLNLDRAAEVCAG